MHSDAIEAGRRPADDAAAFDSIEQLMSPEVIEKSYHYGQVGIRMQKRLPLKQPYETKLHNLMVRLSQRIKKKVDKYMLIGNKKKLRQYLREEWAIIGMLRHGYEFQTVLQMHLRNIRLDLVPTHYDYPEFYKF